MKNVCMCMCSVPPTLQVGDDTSTMSNAILPQRRLIITHIVPPIDNDTRLPLRPGPEHPLRDAPDSLRRDLVDFVAHLLDGDLAVVDEDLREMKAYQCLDLELGCIRNKEYEGEKYEKRDSVRIAQLERNLGRDSRP